MEVAFVGNALNFFVHLSLPILGALLATAFLVGVLQTAMQIDDPTIGFVARLFAVVVFLSIGSSYYSSELLDFTQRVWAGADFYQ